ncbi:hypothetical protein M413DRAFT_41140, partial [Hebeloma cylindrosporum]
HCQVYSHCHSRMIQLGADEQTLNQFRELKQADVHASTAILKPNASGSTSLKLSWIWAGVTRHILPGADAEPTDADAATILEYKRVHWLRARAQKMRWREEAIMVNYEMEWTVRYFLYKREYWSEASSADGGRISAGANAYTFRKAAMWDDLALYADKLFRN